MLKDFLESRKRYRPWLAPAQRLADAAGCSLIMAQEVQWGLYDPLPARFEEYININKYDHYRLETRQQFGEAFDLPRFKTFVALSDYFNASIQEVAKCFCIQRSLIQGYDKAKTLNQKYYRAEIAAAFIIIAGPEYVLDPRNGLVAPVNA